MKWLKGKKDTPNHPLKDQSDDLFGFQDQEQYLNKKTEKSKDSSIQNPAKKVRKLFLKSNKNEENLEELSDSIKDFKRNNLDKNNKKQTSFYFLKNTDDKVNDSLLGTKKGLSIEQGGITQEQIKLLKMCKEESTATELREILKRTNKTKFKQVILNPLIEFGFFELTNPNSPKNPNQKYRLTGKFIRRIQKK